MRYIVLALLFTGCCGPVAEPVMELKSPIWFQSKPVIAPQGWAIQAPQPPALVALPYTQAAPAARACQPGPYAPPPVPQPVDPSEPPESIPAVR